MVGVCVFVLLDYFGDEQSLEGAKLHWMCWPGVAACLSDQFRYITQYLFVSLPPCHRNWKMCGYMNGWFGGAVGLCICGLPSFVFLID